MPKRTVKFEELEVGMLTDKGLIKRILPAGTDKFFGDKPALYWFDLEDPYFGVSTGSVKPDFEYEVTHERGTEEYRKVVQRLIEERYQFIVDAQNDVDFMRALMKP